MLSLLLLAGYVHAAEGFFAPGFLKTGFDHVERLAAVHRLTGPVNGSVFFVSADGHFVTNRHVVAPLLDRAPGFDPRRGHAGPQPLVVATPDAVFYSDLTGVDLRPGQIELWSVPPRSGLKSMAFGPHNDFVLGRIAVRPARWISAVAAPAAGALVFVAGFPQLDSLYPRVGDVGTLRRLGVLPATYRPADLTTKAIFDQRLLVSVGRVVARSPLLRFAASDAESEPGNSGGPVFDETGAVVGVQTAGRYSKEALRTQAYHPDSRAGFFDVTHVIERLRIREICPTCFAAPTCENRFDATTNSNVKKMVAREGLEPPTRGL